MKKRILSLLLVVAMVAAMIVLPVPVEVEATSYETDYSVCPHCGKTPAELEAAGTPWTAYTPAGFGSGNADDSTGHYYLTATVNATGDFWVGSNSGGSDFVLDLRGNTWTTGTGKNARAFRVRTNNSLTVMDSVGGGALIGRYSGESGGGVIYGAGYHTIKLYDIAITDVYTGTRTASGRNGGAIKITGDDTNDSTVLINNCTITGTSAYQGGALYLGKNVKMTVNNTTITGGKTANYGGAIYMEHAGTELTITDSTVTGGTAVRGGVFYVPRGTLNATRCTFNGTTVTDRGGVMYVANDASVTLNSCTVYDGESTSTKNNYSMTGRGIYANDASATVTINGGSVGTLYSTSSSPVLQGAPTIETFYVYYTKPADVSGMTGGNVTVYLFTTGSAHNKATGEGVFTTDSLTNAEDKAGRFTSGDGLAVKVTAENALELGPAAYTAVCQDCGYDGEWLPFDFTNTHITEGGHYYITEDTEITGMRYVGYSVDAETEEVTYHPIDLHIDLNGKSVTSTYRVFGVYSGSELVLQDTTGDAVVTGNSSTNGHSAVLQMQEPIDIDGDEAVDGVSIKLYGGTYSLGGTKNVGYGGVIYVHKGNTFEANNATLDATARKNATFKSSGVNYDVLGGAIYARGTVTLNNCTVNGRNAIYTTDDIYMDGSDAQLNINGTAKSMVIGFDDALFADGAEVGTVTGTSCNIEDYTATTSTGGAITVVDGALYVAPYGAIYNDSGVATIYPSTQAALDAFDDSADAYVKLYCENGTTLTLSKDTVIDLNGAENVTFSGAYTVSGFDSAADLVNHSGAIATLAGGATATSGYGVAADGLRYITYVSSTGDTVEFHRAEMDITGVSLRPGTEVGIYYWAQWDLDNDLIANNLVETGVVYCIDGMPADNFTDDASKSYLYTVIGQEDYADRTEVTGGFMANILAENDATRYNSKGEEVAVTNQDAINWVINATPYINLDNGVTLCADKGEGTAAYSLATLVQAVDGKIVEASNEEVTDLAYNAVNTFYTTWIEVTANNLLLDLPNFDALQA